MLHHSSLTIDKSNNGKKFNRTFCMNTLLHKCILDKSIVNKCPVLISSSTCGPLSRLGVSYLCFWAQSWSIPRCTKAYNIIVYNRYEQNATWATTTRQHGGKNYGRETSKFAQTKLMFIWSCQLTWRSCDVREV